VPAVVSILALAGGIGATATTWSLVSAVLLHPLPVQDPDRLVIVGSRFNQHGYPLYAAVRESGAFETVAAGGSREVMIGRDHPTPAVAYFASHDFFDVLGVRPALGRDFLSHEDRRESPLVAMLSDSYWRRVFGARQDVLGAQVVVSGQPAVVVGVAPGRFRGLDLTEAPDIYLPLHAVQNTDVTGDGLGFLDLDATSAVAWISVVGRLRQGSHPAQAAARLGALFPDTAASNVVTSLNTAAIPRNALWSTRVFGGLMLVTVALLLATGCLAAGVLLLLRTEARRDELAMCLALGASRRRLVRGVVVEGGLLALAGLLAALPVSAWLLAGIRAFELPGGVQVDLAVLSVDASALVGAGSAALLATLLVALAAASFVFSVGAPGGWRAQAGVTPRLARARIRPVLGAAQVAISLVLLAGAGLFARSIAGVLAVGPGVDVRRLVTATMNPRAYGYTDEQASAFFDGLQQRLRDRPAIGTVSIAKPYTNSLGGVTFVDGVGHEFASFIYYQGIDAQYFSMVGLSVIAGRGFSTTDRAESPTVAIVSESLGRLLARGGDPIGRELGPMWWRETGLQGAEVVGVVPDLVTNIALRSPYVIYMPVAQMPGESTTVFLQTRGEPAVAIREVASAIRAIDPAIVPPRMQTVGERLDEQMRAQRFGMLAMGGVGIAAALLTALGIYVMAASLAARRRRELSIRSALGAPRAHLGLIVLREAGLVAGSGLLAGIAIAWASLEPIRAFLFQVEPFDARSVATAAVLLVALIVAVSLKPARAAMRVDVARILAEE
jgi:predicted permease